ncbi:LptF/LptG family permease [Tenuifilum thalassicum]|uniref:YjgP/YjgQ family permease n=1 Tax=Tenuifilum thalassicum TaxID=2590900 RepID=A0A7D3Y5E5_9BACT|nr:LptF/LptG family permease [Tenuifilum thalassicum]QKG80569.1 YjgP/YjgQ family permease [Tenuifilum thalassicum]
MKTLHRFILKSYIGPLVMTFFITMFVLLMQFLWRYIDDLVGKGLEWDVIAELLLYASAGLVPMALPLATLLASLMTMGNLGENNELLAMKSAGISLPRILSPLIVLTIAISIGAFFFSNNVLPYTNLKISTLLYSVKQQKPELIIKEGVFTNLIEGYSIKVSERDQKTGLLRRILIYEHKNENTNTTVTYADSGYMQPTADQKFLVATLFNGNTYKEVRDKSKNLYQQKQKLPAQHQKFEKQVLIFELKGFKLERADENFFKDSYQTQNIKQLQKVEDSLKQAFNTQIKLFSQNIIRNSIFRNPYWLNRDSTKKVKIKLDVDSLYNTLKPEEKIRAIERAIDNARSTKSYISSSKDEFYYKQKYIARHKIEWNRKFTLSFACFVFFFIGAPLGAIIRKGGLGTPVVISVIFFIFYYIINLTGEKFARELIWDPNLGMWVSSFILLPLGIFLSYKATTDSVIMNADFYIDKIKKVLNILKFFLKA